RPGRPWRLGAETTQISTVSSATSRPTACGAAAAVLSPISARLLDLATAAGYLGISPWTVRDLEAAGVLPRVRVPLPSGGELRKLVFDRDDLDRLIRAWKDARP